MAMNISNAEYDTIIIGSGIGGLAAGTRLAQKERKILILEASSDFGGYIRPVIYGEYSFDLGIHYLGKLGQGELFREILNQLGLESFEFVELNPDSIDQYVFPDFIFNFCKGKDQLKKRLIDNFPNEQKGIEQFIDLVIKVDVASAPNELAKGGIFSWIKYLLNHPIMIKYGNITYQTFLDRIIGDQRLKSVLSAPLFDVAVGPKQVSAAAAMSLWGYFLTGAYYPKGGSRAMRDTFVKGLQNMGAKLIHSSPVDKITMKNNKWIVRTEKGEEFLGKTVVSNADPKVTICDLLDKKIVPNRIYKKAYNLKPSGSIISVFIGTDIDLLKMGFTTGNISQFADWNLSSYYDGWLGRTEPSVEQAFFINSPSVRDPEGELAPDGHHTLQLLAGWSYEDFEKWANLSPDQRGEEYEEYKKKISNKLIAQAEKYVKDLSKHISLIKCITSCGIEGLYLVGAGTFGCGLLYCAASGFYTAEAILSK
jgi:phytoene dehydrogenase-like protein